MPTNRIGSSEVFEAHFGIESAFGSGGAQSSATLIKALNSSSVPVQDQARHENEESTGSRDSSPQLPGKYQAIPVSLIHYLRLQKDGATASVIETMLLAAMGAASARVTPSGLTVGPASTVTVITEPAAQDFSVFQLFDVVLINGEPAMIGKIEAAQITLLNPLSAVPAEGSAIGSTRVIRLAQELPPVWADVKQDHAVFSLQGGVVKAVSFASAAEDLVKMTLECEFSKQIFTGTTTLAAAVADGVVTTFTVGNAKAFEIGSRFNVGAETGIAVTAVNYSTNVITVTRGAGAAAHSSGDECVPAWVTGTVEGAIAHGKGGSVRRGSSASKSIPATSRTIKLDNQSRVVNDEDGADYPSYKIEGKRKITNERVIHFRRDDVSMIRDGELAEEAAEIYSIAAGSRGMAVGFPCVELRVPSLKQGPMMDLTQSTSVGVAKDADGAEHADRSMVIATW